MRTIESVMIELGRFVGEKGSWFHFLGKRSGDWGNPLDGTRRKHPVLGMYGLGVLYLSGHSKEAVAGS